MIETERRRAMEPKGMEIGEVRMSFVGGARQAERTERISRLTFQHVQRMMDSRLRRMEQSAEISYLNVGPIHVWFDSMDDETIARESATEIYRALLLSI
jgi:hypothetical protein